MTICRGLAEANPADYRPHLAQGLWGFAQVRAAGLELDSLPLRWRLPPRARSAALSEALAAVEEAIELYTRLAERLPAAFNQGLWGAYGTMADILDDLGRTAEAAGLRRRLAAGIM